jgi:histidyl-tRNA synthetase
MKAADKSGSRYVVIIGGDEVVSGIVELKRMSDGTITSVKISELQKALLGVI